MVRLKKVRSHSDFEEHPGLGQMAESNEAQTSKPSTKGLRSKIRGAGSANQENGESALRLNRSLDLSGGAANDLNGLSEPSSLCLTAFLALSESECSGISAMSAIPFL
jgi:hypothetical protein